MSYQNYRLLLRASGCPMIHPEHWSLRISGMIFPYWDTFFYTAEIHRAILDSGTSLILPELVKGRLSGSIYFFISCLYKAFEGLIYLYIQKLRTWCHSSENNHQFGNHFCRLSFHHVCDMTLERIEKKHIFWRMKSSGAPAHPTNPIWSVITKPLLCTHTMTDFGNASFFGRYRLMIEIHTWEKVMAIRMVAWHFYSLEINFLNFLVIYYLITRLVKYWYWCIDIKYIDMYFEYCDIYLKIGKKVEKSEKKKCEIQKTKTNKTIVWETRECDYATMQYTQWEIRCNFTFICIFIILFSWNDDNRVICI